jgi:hypothetical protein
MRQAGRYHRHYQDLRREFSFMDLCKQPELAARVALGPVLDFDFDAAILLAICFSHSKRWAWDWNTQTPGRSLAGADARIDLEDEERRRSVRASRVSGPGNARHTPVAAG